MKFTTKQLANLTDGRLFTSLQDIDDILSEFMSERIETDSGRIMCFEYLKRINPKPLDLVKFLIKTYSNENDLVLDNTMGVGTTCLGAKELNRKFIGIEKDVKYYDLAVARVFG